MTCMQIINQHFRNATNRTLAFSSLFTRISLIPNRPKFSTTHTNHDFRLSKGKRCAESHFRSTALTIPVIDKQYAFTQYLSASSAYALGLKLAPSPLAAPHYWKILARQSICLKQSILHLRSRPLGSYTESSSSTKRRR